MSLWLSHVPRVRVEGVPAWVLVKINGASGKAQSPETPGGGSAGCCCTDTNQRQSTPDTSHVAINHLVPLGTCCSCLPRCE